MALNAPISCKSPIVLIIKRPAEEGSELKKAAVYLDCFIKTDNRVLNSIKMVTKLQLW